MPVSRLTPTAKDPARLGTSGTKSLKGL